MLIVIAPDKFLKNEVKILVELFSNGLEVFHLRKNNVEEIFYHKFLETIPQSVLSSVVLHEYHNLSERFSVRGIHLKERQRKELIVQGKLEKYVQTYQRKGLTVSTGFHCTAELGKYAPLFDYVFLSPIFDSISKKGYRQQKFVLPDVATPIVAMGGIAKENLRETLNMKFRGVAILGAVWTKKNPVQCFLKIKQTYDEIK